MTWRQGNFRECRDPSQIASAFAGTVQLRLGISYEAVLRGTLLDRAAMRFPTDDFWKSGSQLGESKFTFFPIIVVWFAVYAVNDPKS